MMDDDNTRHLLSQLLQNPIPVTPLGVELAQDQQNTWEALASLAERYSLTPILYHRLRSLGDKFSIPEPIQKDFRQAYLKLLGRNMRMLKHTGDVLQALSDKGLDVIGLKGIYLMDNIYENIGLRYLTDVDLLVKERDLPAVTACLQGLGYHNKTWFDPQDDNQDLMHAPPMINQAGLIIELHWRISFEEDPFAFDIDGLWERAIPARIAGVETQALSLEDLILQLCFHSSFHHVMATGLLGLYDIREVIQQRQDQIDWPTLIQRAQAAGAERVLALTFSLLERVLAYQVPDPSAARLSELVDPDVLNQALSLLFYQPTVTYPVRTEHIAKFLSARGFKERARLILDRFLLPKQEMARRYDVSPHSLRIYCYYPVRLVEFIRKNTGVVKGFLRRGVSQDQVDQGTGEFFAHEKQEQRLRDWMAQQ